MRGFLFFVILLALFFYVTKAKIIFGSEVLNGIRYSYVPLDEKTKAYLDKYYAEIVAEEKLKGKG